MIINSKTSFLHRWLFRSQWLLFCFLLTSCDFLFKPDEISISKIETYDQLINAVGGVYGIFSSTVNSKKYLLINSNSDDSFYEGYEPYRSYYGNVYCMEVTEPLIDVNSVYISLFEVIASINNILDQFDKDEQEDQATKEVLGELYYLRAYCYLRLTRTYGQIPIIDNADVSYTVKKPTFVEIYKFIESDLIKSIKLLPANSTNCRIPFETPHCGTARALLAEVYLSWAGYPNKDKSKYKLAAETALAVIDSAVFYGFELEPDFVNVWNKNGKYSKESVFSLYYDRKKVNNFYLGLYNGSCEKRFYSEKVSTHYSGITTNNLYFLEVNLNTEVNFYNNYCKGYRRDITFFNSIYVPNDGNVQYFQLDTGYIYIDKVDPCSRISYQKFYLDTILIPEEKDSFDSIYGIPTYRFNLMGNPKIYLFRYAQTLLTYAEAAARSGNLDDKAYHYLNMIRRRANKVDLYSPSKYDLQPGLSPESFADSVVAERGWELAGEPEGRWFDLLRLELLDKVLNSTSIKEDNFLFTRKKLVNYFIPIPKSDVELNSNLE
jgi:starch-binding outer membrane protein, SusD/RagB family